MRGVRALVPLFIVGALGAVGDEVESRDAGGTRDLLFIQRVENGFFTTSLRGWTIPGAAGTSVTWATLGSGTQPGSALLASSNVLFPVADIYQCIPNVVPGETYSLNANWYAPPGQPQANGTSGGFYIHLEFNSGTACNATRFPDWPLVTRQFGPAGSGAWEALLLQGTAPPGARSVAIRPYVWKISPATGSARAYVDSVRILGRFGFVKGSFLGTGETDLVLRNTVTNEHRIWFMQEENRVGGATLNPSIPAPWRVVGVDDFDGDGKNDLLVWKPPPAGWLDVWFLNGTSVRSIVALSEDPGPDWTPSATADFNRDGRADIVLRNPVSQDVRIWTMSGVTHTGTITPWPGQAQDANWEVVGARDLDGDGNVDLLWYNSSSGNIVYWLMDAAVRRTSGRFTNPANAGDANWRVLAMGDYGIGTHTPGPAQVAASQDIVWRNVVSGAMVVWFMDRSGNAVSGTLLNPYVPPDPPTDWTIVGPR